MKGLVHAFRDKYTKCAIPDAPKLPGPKLSGNRCHCPTCGDYFGSERGFDRHRVGDYARPGEWRGNRRCLSTAAMEAAGWMRDRRGFLLTPDPRRAGARVEGPSITHPATYVADRNPGLQRSHRQHV